MSDSRWDERCPHCTKELGSIHDIFVNHDYRTLFTFDCPHCGELIECQVHSVPEFELCKGETPEQYRARVEEMKARMLQ